MTTGKIVCKKPDTYYIREQECAFCDGCGIVANKVCKHCNGHGMMASDEHGLHKYSMTDEQLRAVDTLGGIQ